MAEPRVNVLFPTVGRRVELVRCFRRAYEGLRLEGHVIGMDMDPLAPALQVVDRPYLVPRLDSPDYLPALLEVCRREAVEAFGEQVVGGVDELLHGASTTF